MHALIWSRCSRTLRAIVYVMAWQSISLARGSSFCSRKLMKIVLGIATAILLCAADWPPAKSPAVADADGYVIIPNAALSPNKETKYRAIFDATRAAAKPTELLPALNMAASELNALGTVGAPLANAKFVVVFHGSAVDGILRSEQYKAKFGTENPNLATIREMKRQV